MKTLILPISLTLVLGCSAPSQPGTPMQEAVAEEAPVITGSDDSKKVIDHHLEAVLNNDISEVIADYSEASIIITPDSTYKGLDQITAFFEAVLPSFPTEGTTLEIDRMAVENDVVYIVWHGTTPSLEIPIGTDTFIIEEGKIKLQTFAAHMIPQEGT